MAERFKVALIANDDHPIPGWVNEKFAAANIEWIDHQCYNRRDLETCAADADVLWFMSSRKGLVVEENMDIFKQVKAIMKCGSGTDNIDHEACTERGSIIAHTADDPTEPTSDHALALLFTAVRRTAIHDRLAREGIWGMKNAMPVGQFTDAELGLIGLGRIGRAIVRKLSGFNMTIRVYDPYLDAAAIEAVGVQKTELPELLGQSQFILICCPLNAETRGLIGEKELRMMRPDSVLVNCARGGIVVEKALIRALKDGWIAAAALDMVENAPPPPGGELLALDNLNITPHMGGAPYPYPDKSFVAVVDNIIEMSKNRLPKWIANEGVIPQWKWD